MSRLLTAAVALLVIVLVVFAVALVVVRRRETRREQKQAQRRAEVQRFEDASPFDWIVVPCPNREAAEAEARRQQQADTDEAEWIYLLVDEQWSAKRVPTDLALYPPQSLLSKLSDALGAQGGSPYV